MSKIGRKPISVGGLTVSVNGQEIHFSRDTDKGIYVLPPFLSIEFKDNVIKLMCDNPTMRENELWGMHRALLANKFIGIDKGFQRVLEIRGLGYKAVLMGSKIEFSLGYSHKIVIDIPKEVSVKIDKPGKNITLKSSDKEALGKFYSTIRALRPPEVYKGTGIRELNEEIPLKPGKAKAA